jgi:hypothetical protein
MRFGLRPNRRIVLSLVLLLLIGTAIAVGASSRGAGNHAAASMNQPLAYTASDALAAMSNRTDPAAAAPAPSQFGAVPALLDAAARANLLPVTTLHFDGNTDESGCTGVGNVDAVNTTNCPGLVLTPTLGSQPAAHFDPPVFLNNTFARDPIDPNWVWNVSGPTSIASNTMTIKWWASCGACAAGVFDADWFIRLFIDPPSSGAATAKFSQRVTVTPTTPDTAELLTVTLPLPATLPAATTNVVLEIDPVYVNSQQETHIYYDSSLACPTSVSSDPCDSTVTFDPNPPPPPPPAPAPSYASGQIGFGPATVVDFQRTEGEPLLHIDKDARQWETGPWGFSTTQSFVHRSTDGGDQFNVVSPIALRPNSPPGGGDSTIITDDQGFAYFGDLEGALTFLDCSVSNDNGHTWKKNPECVQLTGTDRQWLVVDTGSNHTIGASGAADNTVFYGYHNVGTGHMILSSPGSTGAADPVGGLVFTNTVGDPPNPAAPVYSGGGNCGKLIFEPVLRNLYYSCGAGNHVDMTVGHVNPVQRTDIDYETFALPTSPGGTVSNLFPVTSVDSDGNVYVVWSDTGDHNIYYSFSTNGGQDWSQPVQVNQGVARSTPYIVPAGPAKSNVFAWSQAGTPGNLVAIWLGNDSTTLSDSMPNWAGNPSAADDFKFFGYVALIKNANTNAPTVIQDKFTQKPMHYGQICNSGIGCTAQVPAGDRTMADFLSVDLAPDGSLQIMYNDTTSQHHGAHLYEERQLTGPSAIGTTINKTAPASPVSDAAGDAQSPHYIPGPPPGGPGGPGANQPQLDFRGVALNQQDANTLRVRMSVNNINGFAAPPGKTNAVWITRFQALSKDDTGTAEAYRIFYVGAESVGGGAPTFFAGSPNRDAVTGPPPVPGGCTQTTPGNCKVVEYPNEIAVTGQVSSNTICIDLPLTAFGAGRPIGNTLFNVAAFSAGRDNAATDVYADVDSTRSFDFTLGTVSPALCQAPTGVQLRSFDARASRGAVQLRWRTASEVGTVGFNVWRLTAAAKTKVNRSLISAHGSAVGAHYSFVDRTAQRGASYTYRLQIVNRDGTRSWQGAARVRVLR